MLKNYALPKQPDRILLIIMRYLGDVLLTTALIGSVKQTHKSAKIDILVFENTSAMLEGNPDINRIITIPNNPSFTEQILLYKTIFRKYDLSICTQTGDRPVLAAILASCSRISAVPQRGHKGWWKRYLFQGWVEFDDLHTHTVLQHLKLATVLGIPHHYDITCPTGDFDTNTIKRLPYVILHPHPKRHYKRWSIDGWSETGHYLDQLGFQIVITGSPAKDELDYLKKIQHKLPENTINLAGKLSLAELSCLISKAALFIGPDTGITHLAAATGIPVIAIFGPTNPVKWAPWPFNYQSDANPFEKRGCQCVNNIFLIQGLGDCVPCYKEGCENHTESFSQCLVYLSFSAMKKAIDQSCLIKVTRSK